MTSPSTPLRDALVALELAHVQVGVAADNLEESRRSLSEAGRRYLMESPASELIERAAYVYWQLPDVKASVIASVVVGDPAKVQKLVPLLPPGKSDVKCRECGAEIVVKSRSMLSDIRKATRSKYDGHLVVCGACRGSIDLAREKESRERALSEEAQEDRLQILHTMPYREYLLTEEWLETRNRKLRQAHYKCQVCNGGGLLNVHHRTYERRGYEDMADLIVLCHPCHATFHDKLP